MSRSPQLLVPLAACLAVGLTSGCERVSYWSGTTEDRVDEADPLDGTGGAAASSSSSGGEAPVDEAAVLQGVAVCAGELYGQLATSTATLSRTADAAAASGDEDDRAAAQAAWSAAMDVWEQAESVRVGPVGPASLPGGAGARDEIYAWPLTSRCLVEQTIVSRGYEDVAFGDLSLVNVRGLGAAEYLLFFEGTDNACASTTSINETGAWEALATEDLTTRKSVYAAAVASALDLRARQLDAAWRSDGEGFAAAFAASGTDGAPYATTRAAVQAVFNGLVVVIRQLRDDKLRAVLDAEGCDDATCEVVESPFAHASARLARRQLSGLSRVFDGCAVGGGIGLDDLLLAEGHDDVLARTEDAIEGASAALDAIEGDDVVLALQTDRGAVEAAVAALDGVAQVLEVEVAPALDLVPPTPS